MCRPHPPVGAGLGSVTRRAELGEFPEESAGTYPARLREVLDAS